MFRRRSGFTLIELLVVVAVIGILAAILFPVFARARDAARKAVCINNVKNICLAFAMYATEWDDNTPPNEIAEGKTFAEELVGRTCGPTIPNYINPWLRWPVILEPYIRNREMWKCPSAEAMGGANLIVNTVDSPYWLDYWRDTFGLWWGYGGGSLPGTGDISGMWCFASYPVGWGGEVTDSVRQGLLASALGRHTSGTGAGKEEAFVQGIQINYPNLTGRSIAKMEDPAWTILAADAQIQGNFQVGMVAWPDWCWADCATCWGFWGATSGPADWANCYWSRNCGVDISGLGLTDLTDGRQYANAMINMAARHLGGSNLGFVDGHVRWMHVREILSMAPRWSQGGHSGTLVHGKLKGFNPWGTTTAAGDADAGIEPGFINTSCPPPLY